MANHKTEELLIGSALLTGAVFLAGCGSGGGSGSGTTASTSEKISITNLTVKASGTPITVDGVNGGTAGVTYTLGGTGPRTLSADPGSRGAAQTYSFVAAPTAAPTTTENVVVVLNPAPAEVLAAFTGTPTLTNARDSLARIGFPPSWNELLAAVGIPHARIVAYALKNLSTEPHEAYPAWIDGTILSWNQLQKLSPAQRDAIQERKYPRRQELKAWWFRQMVTAPNALGERLLWFWHNLFTSSASALDHPELMARQHRLYRQHFTGHFGDFVKAMSRDPGMCEYLDSARNFAKDDHGNPLVPNENFARELLELFTLGEAAKYGGYVESDIKDLAHFFTGYHLNYENGATFAFNVAQHNISTKTLFGQTRSGTNPVGGYQADGDWAIDRILEKSDSNGKSYCARYIVSRLWREFIGIPGPSDANSIQTLADGFSANWDLSDLYRAFFTSAAFMNPNRQGKRIRSPVELWVGFYRALALTPTKWDDHLWIFYVLEQDIFDPPNVFGWPGNDAWINLKSVIDRRQFLSWLTWSDPIKKLSPELEAVAPILLLAHDPVDPAYVFPDWRRNYLNTRIARFLVDPAYNLG